MSIRNVKGANNIDMSASRGSQVIREVKLFRRDFDRAKEEIIKAMKADNNADSPYAPDRKTIDHNKIHQSPTEGDWKRIEIRGESTEARYQKILEKAEDGEPLGDYDLRQYSRISLKKLNII